MATDDFRNGGQVAGRIRTARTRRTAGAGAAFVNAHPRFQLDHRPPSARPAVERHDSNRCGAPGSVLTCSVVLGELYYGARHSPAPHQQANLALVASVRRQFASIPFDDKAAEHYGTIRAELAFLGTPIGPNDLMIAAIALANDFTVVTHNTAEFGRVPGLKVEDWQ